MFEFTNCSVRRDYKARLMMALARVGTAPEEDGVA